MEDKVPIKLLEMCLEEMSQDCLTYKLVEMFLKTQKDKDPKEEKSNPYVGPVAIYGGPVTLYGGPVTRYGGPM